MGIRSHSQKQPSCQFYGLVPSYSTRSRKTFHFYEAATSLLKSGLLQLIIADFLQLCKKSCSKSMDIKHLQSTCNKSVVNLLLLTNCCKPIKHILISACWSSLFQDVNRLIARCKLYQIVVLSHGVHNSCWLEIKHAYYITTLECIQGSKLLSQSPDNFTCQSD